MGREEEWEWEGPEPSDAAIHPPAHAPTPHKSMRVFTCGRAPFPSRPPSVPLLHNVRMSGRMSASPRRGPYYCENECPRRQGESGAV
eukprot:7217596-Pyramimonas_sp.AAC.1